MTLAEKGTTPREEHFAFEEPEEDIPGWLEPSMIALYTVMLLLLVVTAGLL